MFFFIRSTNILSNILSIPIQVNEYVLEFLK